MLLSQWSDSVDKPKATCTLPCLPSSLKPGGHVLLVAVAFVAWNSVVSLLLLPMPIVQLSPSYLLIRGLVLSGRVTANSSDKALAATEL